VSLRAPSVELLRPFLDEPAVVFAEQSIVRTPPPRKLRDEGSMEYDAPRAHAATDALDEKDPPAL
jgi:hypothetical protein